MLDPTIKRQDGFFPSKDGTRLYWQSYLAPEPRAHLIVIHGFLDHSGRYQNLYEALAPQGFSLHGFDYRGHGQAGGKRGDVADVSQYVEDLDAQVARVREQAGGRPVFIVSHSQGALIAAHWAFAGKADAVKGVVFSSAFFRLKLPPPLFKLILAKTVGRLVPSMTVPLDLDPTLVSRDPAWQKATADDPLYGRATTPRWNEARGRAQTEVLRRATEFVLPCFFLVCTGDGVADTAAMREFYAAATSKDKELKEYPGFVHEPFNDVGREQPLSDVAGWLNRHLS